MSTRDQMEQGTKLFLRAVGSLDDEALDAPTALPGWTRGHVIAHVHYNAGALRRLLHWARTGEETPMYSGPGQRAAEIEGGASLPADELRALVRESAETLATDLDAMPAAAWTNTVRTAQGRSVSATEIPWMRTREVAVHAVDLCAGITFDDLPDDVNAALVLDVAKKRIAAGEAGVLAQWMTGRTSGAPPLGPWL